MEDFPANSAKAKARTEGPQPSERPRVERVVSGDVDRRRRGLGRKFKETFIAGSLHGARDYVVNDVVVPTLKEMVYAMFQGGLQKLIFGDSRIRRDSPPPSYGDVNRPRINYSTQSSMTRSAPTRMVSRESKARGSFDDIIISSRVEAQDVMDRMYDILSRYEMVLVADLYELTGVQTSHADHRWGWTHLRGAKVARLGDGRYLLDLPEPEPLS